MANLNSNSRFVVDHAAGTPDDPNLASLADMATVLTTSTSVSLVASRLVSTSAAGSLDSVPVSTADSKAVSSGVRASVADSKAISDSSVTSTADSKAISVSGSCSIADSKAVSVATSVPVLSTVAQSQAVSIADSKATSIAAATSLPAIVPSGSRTATTITAYLANNAPVNVLDYAPVGYTINTGLNPTQTAAAFTAAIAAVAVGGTVDVPPGTYAFSAALTIAKNLTLRGSRGASILLFTGATNGVYITDSGNPFPSVSIDGLEIRTSNAGALKALAYDTPTNGAGNGGSENVVISQAGAGRWAYGFFGDNYQSAAVYGLRISTGSATVGLRLQNFCNALKFYDLEAVGGAPADATVLRGIEIVSSYDPQFFGGTFQGYYAQSAAYVVTGSAANFFGVHFENTNASPSDGADVIIGDGSQVVSGSLIECVGGSVLVGKAGTIVRGHVITGGEMTAVTLGTAVQGCGIFGARLTSITDTGALNTVFGCSNSVGQALANRAPGHFSSISPVPVAVNAGGGLAIGNGEGFAALNVAGVAQALLFISAANQTYLQYLGQLNIRDTAGTQRATLSSTGANSTLDLAGTAAAYTVGGTQVLTGRKTGWTAQTTALARADMGATPTLATVASTLAALLADLRSHGMIGT